MLDWISDGQVSACLGAAGGLVLGLAARLGGFCTLGAVEDHLYGADSTRLRMWVLAMALSVLGVGALAAFDLFDPSSAFYVSEGWNPLGVAVGGALFGFGMALTGYCCHGALARLGGGDMRAFFIVLIIAISAHMTLSGPIAWVRLWAFPVSDTPAGSLADVIGVPFIALSVGVGVALAGFSLANRRFLAQPGKLVWSAAVSLAILSAWAGTAWIAAHGFEATAIRSHSFAAPTGETLLYGMTMTGARMDFGVGSVSGVVVGSALGSLWRREFRWEACEDPRELRRQLSGAFLMGVGAVTAVGCSVGQGLSALSVLAPSTLIALPALWLGAVLGLRLLIEDLSIFGPGGRRAG